MLQSTYFKREAINTLFVPKVFSGLNLFLEKPDILPDATDLISIESKKKKAFIVTDDFAVKFTKTIMKPYVTRYKMKFEIWTGSKPDAPIETI